MNTQSGTFMKSKQFKRVAGQSFALTTVATVVTALFSPVYAQPAATALPTGAQVVHGSAAINTIGASMQIQQNSAKLITNWQNFDIGSSAKVEFVQPSAASIALNRVTGSDAASQIFGVLNANGRVFLVNPNGILFGATARIDAGSLVASTLNIRDQDFLAGQYQFDLNNPVGQVKNFGELVAKQGGFVALMGAQVDNAGRVVATGGQAALAAGQSVRMQIGETGLLGMNVVAGQTNTQVSNSGAVIAHGGNVLMSAQSAAGLMSGAVNLTGLVQASRIDGQGGNVRLDGGEITMSQTGRIEATGQGTDVMLWSDRATRMDGTITAKDGVVETSSKGLLGVTGQVDSQQWILDPRFLEVINGGRSNDGDVTWYVDASVIEDFLNNNVTRNGITTNANPRSISLLASEEIRINAPISKTSGAAATLIMGSEPNANANAANRANIVVNRDISVAPNAAPLNIQFGVNDAESGTATINAQIATNGGNVVFNTKALLAHANPVSTTITTSSSAKAGDIIFNKDALLAAPGQAVTLTAKGFTAESGAVTGGGGNIVFNANIASARPPIPIENPLQQVAQALTLDTTGYNNDIPMNGPGNIVLGSIDANVVGGSNLVAGSVDAIKSLTLLGDKVVELKAGTVNIVSSNGDVITGSSRLGTPTLLLNATNTTINVYGDRQGNLAGNVAGYTDFVQSTFDIEGGKATAQTLTINSDRAIKLVNRNITAGGNASERAGELDVNLNPNRRGGTSEAGSGLGGVAMTNANVNTLGGHFIVDRAEGNGGDVQLLTDGFYASNSQIRTEGGALTITAVAPTDTAAGSAIRLTGASTVLSSGSGNMTLNGSVNNFAGSGNKDAVVIGEGGNARVTLTATTGDISITGNASGVGSGDLVTGGSRYNGVVISSKALIETTGAGAGNITIEGHGGGGDKVFISENHGVRFADADTSVVSTTGNIAVVGTSGGKTKGTSGTNSFGIYAEGQNIYVGSKAADYATAGDNIGLLTALPSSLGHVTLAADSMQFVNTSASHMKVASRGELRIHTLNAGTAIEIGATTGEIATAQNSPTQYLGSNWFNGTPNAIFQPGSRNVVIGNARTSVDHVNGEVATVGSTSTMKVTSATTFRDNLVLDVSGAGGKFELGANAPLTVSAGSVGTQGKPNSDGRSLTIQTQAGATATESLLTVDQLQILGSGTQNFNRADGHQINTLAARLSAGDLTLNNNRDLTVGSVSVFGGQKDLPVDHNQKNTWMDTVAQGAKGPTAGTNTTVPTVGIQTPRNVVLNSVNAHLTQTAAGGIRANKLTATAATHVDFFKADGVGTQFEANNVVDLSGVSNKGDFAWKDINGFNVDRLSTLSTQGVIARPDGTQGHTIDLQALSGDITQVASLQAQNLRAQARSNVNLSNVGNLVEKISGNATEGTFAYTDADSLSVASTNAARSAQAVTDGVTAAVTIDLRSVDGALSQTAAGRVQAINLHASAANGVVLDTASANQVANISGAVTRAGDFVYADSNALTVGTVAGVAGLTVTQGNVSLDSRGVLNQTVQGVIETRGLRAVAASGVDLDSAVNKVQTTLAGHSTANNFVFKNAGGFLVGTVKADADRLGSDGISAANQVDLQANASNIAQSAAGGITGASLRAVAPGGVWLATADDNTVAQIAGQASEGHFAFKNTGGDLNVNEAGVRTVSQGVSARDTVDLSVVGAALRQGQSITGNALRAEASGNVTLSNANNHVNLLAGRSTSGDFTYVDAGSVAVATVAAAQDGQVLTAGIQATSAGKTVHLQAANRLGQVAGASVKAPNALLNAAVVDLTERNNEVSVLAGRSDGNFTFYNTSDLSVGRVNAVSGVDRRDPGNNALNTALAKVDIQTRGNLTLNAQVKGRAEGNEALDEAVVLRAEKRFLNATDLREQAIVADGGRWLVYDNNPLLLNKDMNGLASETFNVIADRDFLLINTRFQDYTPASVYAKGNGYITTAQALNPEDVVRVTAGHQSTALGQQSREVTPDQIERMSKMNQLTGVTPTVLTGARGSFAMISSGAAVPLRVAVPMGRAFKLDLRDLVGQGRVTTIAAADGSATPWVSAAGQAELIGTAPKATELVLSIMDPGQAQPRQIRLQLQAL